MTYEDRLRKLSEQATPAPWPLITDGDGGPLYLVAEADPVLVAFQRNTAEKAAEAVAALRELLDVNDEPCWYDHHGYCQAHYLQPAVDCMVKRGREALATLDQEAQP